MEPLNKVCLEALDVLCGVTAFPIYKQLFISPLLKLGVYLTGDKTEKASLSLLLFRYYQPSKHLPMMKVIAA